MAGGDTGCVPEALADIAAALYGLPPEEFTDARNARAKQERRAGERELAEQIGALRKPTLSAWAVNMLARHRQGELDELLQLGAALREAQATLAGDQLRELSAQRHRVVAAMVGEARKVARELGHPLAESVTVQVEETLGAALADPAAEQAVRAGALTSPLSHTGLGPVDLAGAVAVPAGGAAPRPKAPARAGDGVEDRRRDEERRQRERAQAVERAEAAAAEATRTREAVEAAERELTERTGRRTALQNRLGELRDELERTQHEEAETASAVRDARHALDAARRAAAHVERLAERAQADVERLT